MRAKLKMTRSVDLWRCSS